MKTQQTHSPCLRLLAFAVSLAISHSSLNAAKLTASDGSADDSFGNSTSVSNGIGLVGSFFDTIGANTNQGSAYVFRNLDTAAGNIIENVKLTSSDGAAGHFFGVGVSLSGTTGLVGAYGNDNGGENRGAAYVFRDLNTATGTITQNVRLLTSDGGDGDSLGNSVSLSGNIGLVGAYLDDVGGNFNQGSAYVYRNLNTATGTVTQNAKLTASDGLNDDYFGQAVSLSGKIGLVGAYNKNVGSNLTQGAAYVFRNLDTATGSITENVKLTSSDGGSFDFFGYSVSLSGNVGLVGATSATIGANAFQGAAYVYRNLDTASVSTTENAKLIASDGVANDSFGISVSLSGSVGLIGASLATVGANAGQGAVYVYRNLDTATATITENLKLTASDGAENDGFGSSVSLEGDQFVIGVPYKNNLTGKAYSGSISSMTTLDAGNTSKVISGISFTTKENWIIGKTTDGNRVTLSAGDSANVPLVNTTISIGKTAGSDNNSLIVAGTVNANLIEIGSPDGNVGNSLELKNTATLAATAIRLAMANFLILEGDYTNFADLVAELGSTNLQVWDGGTWITVNNTNYTGLINESYAAGNTTITAIPEPGTWAMLGLGAGLFMVIQLRRKQAGKAS